MIKEPRRHYRLLFTVMKMYIFRRMTRRKQYLLSISVNLCYCNDFHHWQMANGTGKEQQLTPMYINVRNIVYKNIILIVGIFKFIAPLWVEFLREFLGSGTFPHWAELTSAFNMGEGPHSIGNVRLAAGKNLHLHLIQIHRSSSVVLAGSISL